MAGLLFIVCIPTSKHELELNERSQGKTSSSDTLHENCIQQFPDRKPESLGSLRNIDSATGSLLETNCTSVSYLSETPKGPTPVIISDIALDRTCENPTLPDSRIERPCEVAVKIEEPGSKAEVTEVVVKKNGLEVVEENVENGMLMEKVSSLS
jgi:hypothetical protein